MQSARASSRGSDPVPDRAALARLDIENELDLWGRAVAMAPGGFAGRDASVAWFASGLPFPHFNQVLATGDAIEPGSLERAVARLRSRQVPFLVRIRSGIDDAVVPRLLALGLLEDADEAVPAMALSPIPADMVAGVRSGPEGLEIRPVDRAGLDDHIRVVADGFGMPHELARQLFPPAELEVPGIAAFTGWLDGRPMAASFGYTAAGTVGIYNVATLAHARGRGIGGAMTRRAITDGVARGATVAILQTSAMGRRLYESLGFREVVVFRAFVEPPPGAPPRAARV